MPQHDLGFLMTLNIGITCLGILGTMVGLWAIIREMGRNTSEITHEVREVAEISRTVAFMVRRQYGDIDRDLQEIKELLGGQ
jgi:hypothetical protein